MLTLQAVPVTAARPRATAAPAAPRWGSVGRAQQVRRRRVRGPGGAGRRQAARGCSIVCLLRGAHQQLHRCWWRLHHVCPCSQRRHAAVAAAAADSKTSAAALPANKAELKKLSKVGRGRLQCVETGGPAAGGAVLPGCITPPPPPTPFLAGNRSCSPFPG